MLGKLLKYELKATGRLLLPLYGVLLLFSVINRIFFAVDRSTAIMESFFAQLVMNLTVFVYGVVVAAVFVVTFFVLIQRFYKNLLGDEGYLMNTLPVRPWKHIVSKMTVAILWSIVSGIVVTLSIMIMSMQSGDFAHIFSGMGQFMQELWRYFGFSGYWAGVHIVILCLLGAGVSVLMVYAALALGHMANKHKILCSFGWFMAINFVSSMLVSILIRQPIPYAGNSKPALLPNGL